jgi:hypothetical protein
MRKDLFYISSNFSLEIAQTKNKTFLTMQLHIHSVNTKDFPTTSLFLGKNLPSVLRTKCFNEENLSFKEEVRATEIGHLFEHILLDQLCLLKIERGYKSAVFNGRTYWNWEKNPRGMFDIVLDIGREEIALFSDALDRTIRITELFLFSSVLHISEFDKNKTSTDKVFLLPVEVDPRPSLA